MMMIMIMMTMTLLVDDVLLNMFATVQYDSIVCVCMYIYIYV